MSDIQNFKPVQKYETFSYLPEMSSDQVRKQIEYALAQGWDPAVEYTDKEHAMSHYWYMWKLPFFGEDSVDAVLSEIEECRRANPGMMVRFIAYDNYAQSQGLAFVVDRGR